MPGRQVSWFVFAVLVILLGVGSVLAAAQLGLGDGRLGGEYPGDLASHLRADYSMDACGRPKLAPLSLGLLDALAEDLQVTPRPPAIATWQAVEATPTPLPTATFSPTPTPSPSATPTSSATPTPSETPTPSATPTSTRRPVTRTPTASVTPTPLPTGSPTSTPQPGEPPPPPPPPTEPPPTPPISVLAPPPPPLGD